MKRLCHHGTVSFLFFPEQQDVLLCIEKVIRFFLFLAGLTD